MAATALSLIPPRCTQAIRAWSRLDDLQRRKSSASATSDFNWSRQTPWRELAAGFFDGRRYCTTSRASTA